MKNNSSKISISWGGGDSSLFVDLIHEEKPVILDYEYDTDLLHIMCGGRCTYVSCSGLTGEGYLDHLWSLLPIGEYRVDTAHNDWQWFSPIGKTPDGVEIMAAVPYVSHEHPMSSTLKKYPTVIKVANMVVFCDFEQNFSSVLRTLLTGGTLPKGRVYKKTFSQWDAHWERLRKKEFSIEFHNLSFMENTPNPWEFFGEELKDFQVEEEQERLFQLLAVEKMPDGTFCHTMKIGGRRYRGCPVKGTLLEDTLTAGWLYVGRDKILVRFYDQDVHILAYDRADAAYEKIARRIAHRMGEGEEFISYVSVHDGEYEYVEYEVYEVVVPKALYLLDAGGQIASVRKGLAQKVRKDIMSRARHWVDRVNDQSILEAIPDDLVVTFEDSLEAGNCQSGTEEFISRYFPGKTSAPVKELKKYADNYHVMRIFHHLATSGRFEWSAYELPE